MRRRDNRHLSEIMHSRIAEEGVSTNRAPAHLRGANVDVRWKLADWFATKPVENPQRPSRAISPPAIARRYDSPGSRGRWHDRMKQWRQHSPQIFGRRRTDGVNTSNAATNTATTTAVAPFPPPTFQRRDIRRRTTGTHTKASS